MRPYVVVHAFISADGRISGFDPDVGLYYETARVFEEDCMLTGADTILAGDPQAAEDEPIGPPRGPIPTEGPPLLAVVDTRGRIRKWQWLREQPYWRDAVAVVSRATPGSHLAYLRERGVDHLLAGEGHADLAGVLTQLRARYGVEKVRVDSGGALAGALLHADLVDEVSLLYAPVLVGDRGRPFLRSPLGIWTRLESVESLSGGVVWARYAVSSSTD